MSRVLRPVRKRKKGRTLGPVEIIRREDYADLELDAKVELILSLVPLGLMHVEELLDAEVTALAGERYARKDASVGGRRHGSNPGTVGLAGQRVPIRVPRIRHVAGNEMRLRSYEALQGDRAVNDRLLKRVLYGISCRNYEAAAEAIPGAIGLSGSTVSRGFIQASAAQLREFQERDLSGEDVVAVVLDGKTFADATMVIALGITLSGEKRFLGFVETDTENAQVLTPFLRSLVERGLDVSQGVLVILDGGKGLRSAVRKAFRDRALVHRCQWHKRENVVRYLAKREQASCRQRLQRAYNRPTYTEALGALEHHELEDRNQSAAGSLAEGLDETLTLHRLGLYGVLGRSLKTTNCLESINALVEERPPARFRGAGGERRVRVPPGAPIVPVDPDSRRHRSGAGSCRRRPVVPPVIDERKPIGGSIVVCEDLFLDHLLGDKTFVWRRSGTVDWTAAGRRAAWGEVAPAGADDRPIRRRRPVTDVGATLAALQAMDLAALRRAAHGAAGMELRRRGAAATCCAGTSPTGSKQTRRAA